MQKKLLIFIFSALILAGMASGIRAQTTLDSLTEKIGQISIEGRVPLDVLNEITQEGELDSSVPKRTISKGEGKIETIFVFDFGASHQQAFDDLQGYFLKEEGFQMQNQKEEAGLKARELQKGTTKILLVKKDNIVVEDRLEGFLSVSAPAGTEDEKAAGTSQTQIIIIIAGVVVLAVCGFAAKRFWPKKPKVQRPEAQN
jgi:hypothetical protein